MDTTQLVESLLLAIALAAASGLRVSVPPLVVALAARGGVLSLNAEFQWLGSTPAIVVLALAAVLEICAYSIPWLDHALDVIATPAAIVAGFLLSAAVLSELDPMLRWILALVVGGGAAAMVQIPTAIARAVSTWSTAGVANPVLSTAETAGSTLVSVAAILAPFVALLALALTVVLLFSRRPREARVTDRA